MLLKVCFEEMLILVVKTLLYFLQGIGKCGAKFPHPGKFACLLDENGVCVRSLPGEFSGLIISNGQTLLLCQKRSSLGNDKKDNRRVNDGRLQLTDVRHATSTYPGKFSFLLFTLIGKTQGKEAHKV